jgi:hypothetical protein
MPICGTALGAHMRDARLRMRCMPTYEIRVPYMRCTAIYEMYSYAYMWDCLRCTPIYKNTLDVRLCVRCTPVCEVHACM